MYTYHAKMDESRHCCGAYDGDTIDLTIDLGFRMTTRQRIRLLKVDTPEVIGETKSQGIFFRELTRGWLQGVHRQRFKKTSWEFPLTVITKKRDSFGRYLAVVKHRMDPAETYLKQSLNQYLLDCGAPAYPSLKSYMCSVFLATIQTE